MIFPKLRKMIFFLSPLLFVFESPSQGLTKEQERYKRYKPAEILEIAKRFEDEPTKIISYLDQKLNEFYLSDVSQKKIQAQKKIGYGPYNIEADQIEEFNTNLRRLFMKFITSQKIKGLFTKEARAIFLIHRIIAQNSLKLPDPRLYQSAFHYRQSFKYRSLRLDPDIFTSLERLELLDEDDPQIRLADQYRNIRKASLELENERQKLKEKDIVLKDSLYFSDNSTVIKDKISENRQKIASIEENISGLNTEFKKVEEQYKDFANEWNEESGDLLHEFAKLIKRIENNLKEKQKVLNHKSIYKTSFIDHSYTGKKDFKAYSSILEVASNLDPKNAKLSFELGSEYKASQKIRKATSYFHKALETNPTAKERKKLSQDEINKAYTALGSLYYQAKRFVGSAQYYEKALELDRTPGLLYQLGKLHYQKTGNYKRVVQLLSEYLKGVEDLNPKDVIENAHWQRNKFFTLSYMARSYKKLKEYSSMLESMESLRQILNVLNQAIQSQRQELNASFKQLQETKKPILDQTTQAELNQYYLIETRHKEDQSIFSKLLAVKSTLPLRHFYFDLGNYLEKEKDITKAIDVYREAEKNGVSPDAARRNIARLKKMFSK